MMTKQEFMYRLAQQLVSLPPEERLCALKFYDEYFADAGEENWEALLRDLGSPEEVARAIQEDFAQRNPGYNPSGSYAYRPGPQYRPGQGPQTYTTNPETYVQRGYGPQPAVYQKRSGCGTVLVVMLLILGSPLWLVLLIAALGVFIGLVGAVIGVVAAVVALIVSLVGAGVVCVWGGITTLALTPGLRLLALGGGLMATGGGLLIFALCVWLAVNVLPPVFRWLVDLCRRPFQK